MQFPVLTRPAKAGIVTRTLFVFAIFLLSPALLAKDCFVYFGTFTDASSRGVYVSRLDMDSGKLSAPELAAAVESPNYLAISPDGRFLFAATRGDNQPGFVTSFAIDGKTGELRRLDIKSSGGEGPCYVGDDAADDCLLAANYTSGSVKSFHLNSDGTFTDSMVIQHSGSSVNRARQMGPHPHCFVPAPEGRFALACDLGLDKVMVYKVNPATAALTPNDPSFASIAPGSGPRHIAFSPDGKTACMVCEMACTVTVFDWDGKRGVLAQRQSLSLLPPGQYQDTFTAAEIAYRPDGRFVYATVRGHNSVSALAVKRKKLSLIQNIPCGGNFPRGMGIDPSGHWLIVGNQNSRTVTVFGINKRTGMLAPTGQVVNAGISVDVKFAPVAE
ncbi:MAG TPA: lactonase family protein [Candidatus Acidoferrales bacterium]|jgi:6-phosphogluconolactonase|nr:lactonase family protein [Candidatus Acidoferrales bacterium]